MGYSDCKFSDIWNLHKTEHKRPSGKVAGLGPEGSRFETRFHRRSVLYWACCTLNHRHGSTRATAGVVRKFGEGVPAQVSFSSSGLGSKLRDLSQNSPRVALKWDTNITKLD
ncbi:hypothetical protein AVEN_109237-1 [Araneus ventricosus]|uniref:Uncharacterized protein n=1 Tax=Araneus ventricosus TaxID=182803 RepID=A0A4Y2GUM4_ARAVE|nr:hypothetical protein AVEN_80476-1 [Araneus ventricosus]GBM55815.1 hypothetical protein AVEN_109237-1 [Araneus ventricosus]